MVTNRRCVGARTHPDKAANHGMFIGKLRLSISFIALGIAGPASALGFGDFRASALLGQPLNLALPVSLAEGETLASNCVTAEVQSGDSRLQPGTVRARVTQGRDASEAIIRISTTVAIDEPVVNVSVSAGCPPRITRTLTLLADPPLVSVAAAPAAAPDGVAASRGAVPSEEPSTNALPPTRATRPATPPRATRAAPARNVAPAGEAVMPQTATATPRPRSRPSANAATAPAKPSPVEQRPRLQLDGGQVAATPAAVLAAAEAQASAARQATLVAEAAASAAQQRMKDMEGEVARLRADAKAQTDALVELRKQIAQDRNRPAEAGWLMPALMALAGLLGATALWLAWQLRQKQNVKVTQRDAWYERAAPASVANSMAGDRDEDSDYMGVVPSRIPSTLPPPPPATPRPPINPPSMFDTRAGGLDSMISPPTMPAHTNVTLPLGARVEDDPSRAMSVDEQIDLEQQADFFIALGHDESAIDLLMAHLRSTGGGTPLPFLKLLEIHGRRGDREAYERTRVRFNQRFNSVAPEWQADPKSGRALEDYPLVVGRIQTAWPTPLDAMAELEALLFRRGAGSEMFELPAYQEVLFLFQLARDLHQQSQPDSSNDVDVLLPISSGHVPLADGTISLRPEFNGGQAMTLDFDLDADKPMVELDLGSDDDTPLQGGKPDPGKRLS
jgi:pilus assembly protein FimV